MVASPSLIWGPCQVLWLISSCEYLNLYARGLSPTPTPTRPAICTVSLCCPPGGRPDVLRNAAISQWPLGAGRRVTQLPFLSSGVILSLVLCMVPQSSPMELSSSGTNLHGSRLISRPFLAAAPSLHRFPTSLPVLAPPSL